MNCRARFVDFSAVVVLFIFTISGIAQTADQNGKPREITSGDFGRTKSNKTVTSTPATSRKQKTYRLLKTIPAPRRKPVQNAAAQTIESDGVRPASKQSQIAAVQQIGITFWLLRPSTAEDKEPMIRVLGDSGKPTLWTPVRVSADHDFVVGDLVRLTVESPQDAYLYVIDRETYRNGSFGEAMLIFPTYRTRDGDNRLSAGYLIDIPSWTDRVPYYMLSSRDVNYVGELLTFIVSPQPLPLNIGRNPLPISNRQLETWESEWGTEADLYQIEGTVGEPKTQAEQEATRPHTRQLTQEEPVPQTVYRITVQPNRPFLINISVRAKQASN